MIRSNEFDIENIDSEYIWDRRFMSSFIDELNSIESEEIQESCQKYFINMKVEIINAYREFEKNLKDLPLIMKCRVKCDKDSNFGGLQCYFLVSKIEHAITNYLNNLECFDEDPKENSLTDILKKIKDKAPKDKAYASNFEKETKRRYLTYGKDDTLEIFKNSGYNINLID